MKKVRLIKGLSYRGHGMYIKKGEVQSVDDSKAEELVAGGFFEIAGEASVNDDNSQNDANIDNGFNVDDNLDNCSNAEVKISDKPVSKMNGTELRAYADAKGYDISECTKVEEIRDLVEELDAQAADDAQ